MFADDGAFGPELPHVDWDPHVTPSTRIYSTVIQYMPMELLAGTSLSLDAWTGIMQDMYPCDVYIQYSFRIDVLQVHDFVLKTAVNPPNPTTPQDYFTWTQAWWQNFLANVGNWFANPFNSLPLFLIVGVVIVLVLAVFFPAVFVKITGGD